MTEAPARHPFSGAPLIAITGRRGAGALIGAPRGFADAPVDIYLSEYAESVVRAGGLPVHIPLVADAALVMDRMDGLLIAGGEDVDPRRYGQSPGPWTTVVDPLRDQYEIDLIAAAIARDVPVLGICRGQQILNVARGGTLVQHLEFGEGESHGSYAYPRAHRVHDVEFTPDSTLARVYGSTVRVNSFHHQAVDRPGEGVVVAGRASDGVIEAIEVEGARALGVQWHPEVFGGDPIFDWLVRSAAAVSVSTDAQEAAA